jgi:hypothetical protein
MVPRARACMLSAAARAKSVVIDVVNTIIAIVAVIEGAFEKSGSRVN